MANVPIDQLTQRLWPMGDDDGVFAVLDCARDAAAHGIITESRLEHRCLYVGEIAPVLARAAPWIVRLSRDDAASRQLLMQGWGESWAIYGRASQSLATLHRHFRRMLRVRDERGATLLFRFYDPRVMRVYLPTCTRDELSYVFGPVERYVIEGEEPESILEFRDAGGALARSEVRVEKRLRWLGDYLRKNRDA